MKVKDLIEKLEKMGLNKEVMLSQDEEGNGYFELDPTVILEYKNEIILYPIGPCHDWDKDDDFESLKIM